MLSISVHFKGLSVPFGVLILRVFSSFLVF